MTLTDADIKAALDAGKPALNQAMLGLAAQSTTSPTGEAITWRKPSEVLEDLQKVESMRSARQGGGGLVVVGTEFER